MHEIILSMDLACLALGRTCRKEKNYRNIFGGNLIADMTGGSKLVDSNPWNYFYKIF